MCKCGTEGGCSPIEQKSCALQKALDWAFRDVTNEEEAIMAFDSLLEILPEPDEGWEPQRLEVEDGLIGDEEDEA